jgi:hypothetical protein
MTKIVKNTMTQSLKKLERVLEQLPETAYELWLKNTPKNSGNARRKTRLKGKTIHADYAYAKSLNEGSSRQAPSGISEPTAQALSKHLNSKMRK